MIKYISIFQVSLSLMLSNSALSYEVQIHTCIKNECLTYYAISHIHKYYLYYVSIKENLLYQKYRTNLIIQIQK